MITFLSIICFILFIWCMSLTAHIKKIQKELENISKEQFDQNSDIRKLIVNSRNLIEAVNDITSYINDQKEMNSIKPWHGDIPIA